jgi:UDP-2,3-diacylglucosamine hydrolase
MPTWLVSDLHLEASRPEITEQFLGFLKGDVLGADALYILGDLFEASIGDDDPNPHQALIQNALAQLSTRGVPIYVLHGNRDFLLGERFCTTTGATLVDDPTIVERYGQRVLLTHGDALCIDDVPYQRLRALVRDPIWQRQLRKLSIQQRQTLAAQARTASRAHTTTQAKMLTDVNAGAVERLFRDADVSIIVHGHTHRPGTHQLSVDSKDCTRIVTGDWDRAGSVLRWDESGFTLESRPRLVS